VEIVKKKRVKRYKRKPTVKRILNPYEESVFTFQELQKLSKMKSFRLIPNY
jgi:hypothetical protein